MKEQMDFVVVAVNHCSVIGNTHTHKLRPATKQSKVFSNDSEIMDQNATGFCLLAGLFVLQKVKEGQLTVDAGVQIKQHKIPTRKISES